MQSNTVLSASEREIREDSGPQRVPSDKLHLLSSFEVGATHPLDPTSPELLAKINRVQDILRRPEYMDVPLKAEHLLHGGMYARTLRIPPSVVVTGSLIKRATVLITSGTAKVLISDGWASISGYNVIAARAGRKQIVVTVSELEWTMIFPTNAKTVAEAEADFTDETELLMETDDLTIITGE